MISTHASLYHSWVSLIVTCALLVGLSIANADSLTKPTGHTPLSVTGGLIHAESDSVAQLDCELPKQSELIDEFIATHRMGSVNVLTGILITSPERVNVGDQCLVSHVGNFGKANSCQRL